MQSPNQGSNQGWMKQVVNPPDLPINQEIIERQKVAALRELQNDIVDFRGVTLDFLKKFWRDIVKKRKFENVELYTLKAESNGKTYMMLEKTKRKCCLVDPFGNHEWHDLKSCASKPFEKWTVWDVAKFCLSSSTALTNKNVSFVDSLFPNQVGKPFEGAYVIVPSSCTFDSLVHALKRHEAKKKEALKKENENAKFPRFVVWLKIFSAKKETNLFDMEDVSDEEMRKMKMYKYVSQVTCKMIELFDERLIYLDNWKSPGVFRRAWCLYEVFGAVSCLRGFDFVYDTPTAKEFYMVLSDADDHELDSNLVASTSQCVFNTENIFRTIENLEPSFISCKSNLQQRMILDAFSELKNGFTSVIHLLRRYICKVIASKFDDDVILIMNRVSNLTQRNDKSLFGVCNFLNQVGLFMRNLDELDASCCFLETAIKFYKVQDHLPTEIAQNVKQRIPVIHISLARTQVKKRQFDKALEELEKARSSCADIQTSEKTKILQEVDLVTANVLRLTGRDSEALTIYQDILNNLQEESNSVLETNNEDRLQEDFEEEESGTKRVSHIGKLFQAPKISAFSQRLITTNSKFHTVELRKARLCLVIGEIYETLGQLAEAESHFNQAKDTLKDLDLGFSMEFVSAELGIAGIKAKRKDYRGSEKKYTAALEVLTKKIGSCNPLVIDVLEKRAARRRKLGDQRSSEDTKAAQDIRRIYYGKPLKPL